MSRTEHDGRRAPPAFLPTPEIRASRAVLRPSSLPVRLVELMKDAEAFLDYCTGDVVDLLRESNGLVRNFLEAVAEIEEQAQDQRGIETPPLRPGAQAMTTEEAAALPGSVVNGYRCKVFIVEDSGRHIVAANKITDAYRIVAEMALYATVEDYVREEEPSIRECQPYEEICVNMTDNVVLPNLDRDDLDNPDDWPEGVRVETTVVVRGFAHEWMARDWTGLIGTTEV